MIAFVRTANIAPGKTAAAFGFASEMTAYLKATHGVEAQVLRPIGGNPNRVAWSSRFPDLTAYGAFNDKLRTDARYWEMVGKAADCFMAGSVNDDLWQAV